MGSVSVFQEKKQPFLSGGYFSSSLHLNFNPKIRILSAGSCVCWARKCLRWSRFSSCGPASGKRHGETVKRGQRSHLQKKTSHQTCIFEGDDIFLHLHLAMDISFVLQKEITPAMKHCERRGMVVELGACCRESLDVTRGSFRTMDLLLTCRISWSETRPSVGFNFSSAWRRTLVSTSY